jgi:hypothetical protein
MPCSLSQPHARTAAIRVDELDAGVLKGVKPKSTHGMPVRQKWVRFAKMVALDPFLFPLPNYRQPSQPRQRLKGFPSARLHLAFVAKKTANRSKALVDVWDGLRRPPRFRHQVLKEALPFGDDAQEIQLGFRPRSREICLDGRGGFADQLERELISAARSGDTAPRRDSPWRDAFWLERALPSAVTGPRLFLALRRFAAICFSDVTTRLPAATARGISPARKRELCH